MRSPEWFDQVASAVRGRRKALRLTQIALAELAGVGADFVYDVERGKPTLRLDKLLQVFEVLGVRLVLEPGKGRFRVDERLATTAKGIK
jgi:HTH-type transcriptional regulator / antitoxin HipB